MIYTSLPEDLRKEFESKKFAMVRRGSLIGEHSVNDAVLLDIDKPISSENLSKLNGYSLEHVSVWFEYVSSPLGEDVEKAISLVKNALLSV